MIKDIKIRLPDSPATSDSNMGMCDGDGYPVSAQQGYQRDILV
jgi:hypothetical protein